MNELRTVGIDRIRIPDVRVNSILDEEQRALLASTVQQIGVVQDIVVRSVGVNEYELVAGKSRLEALKAQGLTETQVKVIDANEKLGLIMNIVENVARGSYDYISIAQAVRKLRQLGTLSEELEKIFPWRKRWIEFLEGLQDLPDDVVQAIQEGKVTPTHVQIALNLPTPIEIHDGLRTVVNLGWDTATFKIFVQNRVDQISRAREEASAKGQEPEIPAALPDELIRYKQCLVCGYKKPAETVTIQLICEPCIQLTKYITDQLGPAENAIQTVYQALQIYFGSRPTAQSAPAPTPPGPSRE